jgi:hypothetical protein
MSPGSNSQDGQSEGPQDKFLPPTCKTTEGDHAQREEQDPSIQRQIDDGVGDGEDLDALAMASVAVQVLVVLETGTKQERSGPEREAVGARHEDDDGHEVTNPAAGEQDRIGEADRGAIGCCSRGPGELRDPEDLWRFPPNPYQRNGTSLAGNTVTIDIP